MKRFSFIVLGALTLLGLSACVERQEVNPYFDPETKSVNTQFVLNIASANGVDPDTKQSAVATQRANNFRGIDNATMFAFIQRDPQDSSQFKDGSKVLSHTAVPAQMYNLSTVLGEGTISSSTGTRVMEVSLPTGTNSILFYAAAYRKPQTGLNNDELYGCLEYTAGTSDGRTMDMTLLGSLAKPRLNDSNRAAYHYCEALILNVINHLIRVGFNDTDADAGGWCNTTVSGGSLPNGTYNLSNVHLHWYNYAVAASSNAEPRSPLKPNSTDPPSQLETILGNAYVALTTINYTEIRAGSGLALERQMDDLYSILDAAEHAGYKSDEEYVALKLVDVLKTNLKYFFNVSTENKVYWKSVAEVQGALLSRYGITVSGSTTEDLTNFPRHFHIPLGGATLIVDEAASKNKPYVQYAYNDTLINLGMVYYGDTSAKYYIGVEDFTYTPELCYYCNSPIWVTEDNALSTANFPTNVVDWNTDSKWRDLGSWVKNSHVTSSTRGVALVNNVQYGVGLLESKVQVDEIQLLDNNANLHPGESAKTINLSDNSYLLWTGILVGGQPDKVGWLYQATPQTTVTLNDGSTRTIAASKFNKMIYDKVGYVSDDSEGYKLPVERTATSPINYTLVFDNYDPDPASATKQQTVYVALEFKNMLGTDFWGNANVIRDSGTFYIIAAIEPKAPTEGDAWWTDARTHYNMMPPYDSLGNTKHVNRVFMEDFYTKATFHLSTNSLQKAFTTVPDLRSAKLSLGLSVDLTWQEGIDYHVVLGGGSTTTTTNP